MVTQSPTEPTWLTIIRLLRWDKPAGRLILMVPALWALFLAAEGKPPWPLVAIIIVGSLTTSAAGCVINDLWDRNIDPLVERTRNRPLAARAISVRVGVAIVILSFICAAILALYLNSLSFWFCVAAVPVIISYPLAKRVFPVPQLVLSLAWGFAVLISWSAVTANVTLETWLLWGATVFWTLGFDTAYAMSDKEDDEKIGVNSSARFFGKYAADAIGIFFAITSTLLIYLCLVMHLSPLFWLVLGIAVVSWLWQYLRLRQKIPQASVYPQIFRENVMLGFILLIGMVF